MPQPVPALRPPYYVVVFTSRLRATSPGYEAMAETMVDLAQKAPGFLGMDSARGAEGLGITVSYWTDEAAIAAWKADTRHLAAQRLGIADWYESYSLHIARVERAYSTPSDPAPAL